MYNVICAHITPFCFLHRLKINHAKTKGEYAFILGNGVVANTWNDLTKKYQK
jgi:hypothetical protein